MQAQVDLSELLGSALDRDDGDELFARSKLDVRETRLLLVVALLRRRLRTAQCVRCENAACDEDAADPPTPEDRACMRRCAVADCLPLHAELLPVLVIARARRAPSDAVAFLARKQPNQRTSGVARMTSCP